MLLALLLLVLPSSSFGADVTLSSANDFTGFVNKVNSGTNYSGTTVYLGSDIVLTGSINLIGLNETYNFRGVFDGQGHIINNLQINFSSQYTGLFGFSKGLTIRNVVLGESCFIESSFNGSDAYADTAYVGGVVGYCYAYNRKCNIENNVNMAGVIFSGSITDNLFIGGVVGYLYSSNYGVHVKNCVNYGSVTNSGRVGNWAEIGGIVGFSQGSSSTYNSYIQNCLNYGTITHNGTSTYLIIGGVVGNGKLYTYIENCVSAGKITTPMTASKDNYVGSIAGNVDSDTYINYCYYTSDVNVTCLYGIRTPTTTGTPNSTTAVNSGLISKLNANATSCNWSKWLLNANNATVTFKMSDDKELSFSTQIILIPNPVKEGNTFLFWCKDAEYAEKFDPATEQISKNITLYAAWANNTVIFDANGGNVSETSKIVTFSKEYGDLPEPNRAGYIFIGWFDEKNENVTSEKIVTIPKNHILYAKWAANIYTVTFNVSGGDLLPEDEATKMVTFNEKYGELPEPNRTGYMFLGWFNESGGFITNVTIVTTPSNHTLYAHWEKTTNQVEIVFNKKDLTKEEVKNIVKKYTKADFEITKFEKSSESGEINVIIKFVDKKDAENFFRRIKQSSEMSLIKKIAFDQRNYVSFSTMVYPLSFLSVLFL